MINKIAQLIGEAKYEEAYLLMAPKTLTDKWEFLSTDLYDEDPKTVYTFLLYLIAKDGNEAEWQFYCCLYLIYCNPFFDDTMCLAAWHIKKALSLEPSNIEYEKVVISTFYSYSEQHFTNEEYCKYSKHVLEKDPSNTDANEIILNLHE